MRRGGLSHRLAFASYKDAVMVTGRKSETDSLFDASIVTFEDDAGAYNQKDAEGFIKLNALRLKILGKKR